MGGQVGRLVRQAPDLALAGGIAPASETADPCYPAIVAIEEASALLAACDVVVDFSAPDHLTSLLRSHADVLAGRALVVGTTGLHDDALAALDVAARGGPVLVAANFSIGVNVLLELARRAARVLGPDAFDVEIVESHHRHKADSPSGTALALGRAVAQARGVDLGDVRRDGRSGTSGERPIGEIGFHALRGGEVVGDHAVRFIGAHERIDLGHVAADRALFAEGALRAARWIVGKAPGTYQMSDVLGLTE